ncbi:amidase [Acinetobacter baylyi]|uniref:amidase n=1 Tax=Acinetobacter baylyi TaxID=202950 RepID=UPI000EA3C7FF|nr:amidase [Acinetobacter baylyi]
MDNIFSEKMILGQGKFKVAIKDTIDLKGYKTQAGSASLINTTAALENAEIIQNLLEKDCQILGKTNLHELAFGITGINHFAGTAINPKYPDLIPGGSSSGSAAAVAANLVDFSIGTDTGGSIRMPAACCGVFGLKPTFGRVSRKGVLPKQTSLDCVGPFAANMEYLIQAMSCIDPTFDLDKTRVDFLSLPLKLAVLDVFAEPEVWQTIEDYLTQCEFKDLPRVNIDFFEEAYHAGMQIINYETFAAFGDLLSTKLIGQDVAKRLQSAAKTTRADVQAANQVRQKFVQAINQLLQHYDALILPTLPQIPPKVTDAENTVAFLNLTALIRPFNLSGHPAMSIPLQTKSKKPIGLQIVTKSNSDEYLCALARYLVNLEQSSTKECDQ